MKNQFVKLLLCIVLGGLITSCAGTKRYQLNLVKRSNNQIEKRELGSQIKPLPLAQSTPVVGKKDKALTWKKLKKTVTQPKSTKANKKKQSFSTRKQRIARYSLNPTETSIDEQQETDSGSDWWLALFPVGSGLLGLASFITLVASALAYSTPLFFTALALGILAIIAASIGLSKYSKNEDLVGIIFSALFLVISAVWTVFLLIIGGVDYY